MAPRLTAKRVARRERKSDDEIRGLYFKWLYDLVDRRQPDSRNRALCAQLHRTEFYGLIPNDDNRGEDGIKLRDQFKEVVDEFSMDYDYPCLGGPCTVFEMIIGLAIRIQDIYADPQGGNQTARWFWEMVKNLGLTPYWPDDPDSDVTETLNDDILEKFLNRRYLPNGKGGLFPLKSGSHDQRTVEIWYQLQDYLEDWYPMN